MESIFNLEENQEYILIDLQEKKNNKIRLSGTTETPYFCGLDVCVILEYKNTEKTLQKLVKDKYKKSYSSIFSTPPKLGGVEIGAKITDHRTQRMIYVSEPGLYSLIMKSKAVYAESFQELVYEKILPSIRKYGSFQMLKTIDEKNRMIEEMSETNKILQRRILNTKYIIDNIKTRDKKLEWIYIATSETYFKERIFKIGSTERLTKRLSTYNTGRIDSDVMFYCWVKKCYVCKDLDNVIQSALAPFKCHKNREMYRGVRLTDLKILVEKICDNYDGSLEFVNEFLKHDFQKSLELEDEPVDRIDLKVITADFGEGRIEVLDDLDRSDLREEIIDLIRSYKSDNLERKLIVADLETKISGYDKRSIWATIKTYLQWKDSKTACLVDGREIRIKY